MMTVNAPQNETGGGQITDTQKLKLFLCAIRTKAMAEDAIEKPQEVQPHFRAFGNELERRWQKAMRACREAPPEQASRVLREFAQPLEEGLRQGEAEMQRSFLDGEDIEERFVFWWLLRIYRDRSNQLEAELAAVPAAEAQLAPADDDRVVIDEEALSSFEAAMELAL